MRRPRGSEYLYDDNDAHLGPPRYNNNVCTLPLPDEVHVHPEPLHDDNHARTTMTTWPQGHCTMMTTCAQSPCVTTTRQEHSSLLTHLLTTPIHSVPCNDNGHTAPVTATWAPSPCVTMTTQALSPRCRRCTWAPQRPHPQTTTRPHPKTTTRPRAQMMRPCA